LSCNPPVDLHLGGGPETPRHVGVSKVPSSKAGLGMISPYSISNGLPFALAILGYLAKTTNLFLQWFAKTLAKL